LVNINLLCEQESCHALMKDLLATTNQMLQKSEADPKKLSEIFEKTRCHPWMFALRARSDNSVSFFNSLVTTEVKFTNKKMHCQTSARTR
jgi:hypothetical protein